MMGRRLDTNEEIEDAPESAHVTRSAQESYHPPAFMVRRSILGRPLTNKASNSFPMSRRLDRYEG
ncbi:MAG: hypothetical protein MPW15_21955 [Candidatus Manganitrophus sp.]|nr:hypothetical protein [Candidatus Manganitrophus sp.]